MVIYYYAQNIKLAFVFDISTQWLQYYFFWRKKKPLHNYTHICYYALHSPRIFLLKYCIINIPLSLFFFKLRLMIPTCPSVETLSPNTVNKTVCVYVCVCVLERVQQRVTPSGGSCASPLKPSHVLHSCRPWGGPSPPCLVTYTDHLQGSGAPNPSGQNTSGLLQVPSTA